LDGARGGELPGSGGRKPPFKKSTSRGEDMGKEN